MQDFLYWLYLRLAGGRSNWHNRHFPPSFEVACDHASIQLECRGHRMQAAWFSSLTGTKTGRCHIVLSGPSIKTIKKPSLLGSKYSIWVNNSPVLAIEAGVRPSLYLVCDRGYVKRQLASFQKFSALSDACLNPFCVPHELLLRADCVAHKTYLFDDPAIPLRRQKRDDGPVTLNCIKGGHSVGVTALRAAMQMGFGEILLFGLDLGGQARFYDEAHPEPSNLQRQHAIICAEFTAVADEAHAAGVKIMNCSPQSRLSDEIFEKCDPNDALA
jgi:hypothetical protein